MNSLDGQPVGPQIVGHGGDGCVPRFGGHDETLDTSKMAQKQVFRHRRTNKHTDQADAKGDGKVPAG